MRLQFGRVTIVMLTTGYCRAAAAIDNLSMHVVG